MTSLFDVGSLEMTIPIKIVKKLLIDVFRFVCTAVLVMRGSPEGTALCAPVALVLNDNAISRPKLAGLAEANSKHVC